MAKHQPRRSPSPWDALNAEIVSCERCPRLREYCLNVAREKKAAHREEPYWGLPAPNFGDPKARIVVIGLAPAAHGANRTGRLFTGDRSGDYLYRALHAVGLANQPTAVSRDDGLKLIDCVITDVGHCAPPDNKPTPAELENCSEWLQRTFRMLPARVFVPLGQIAWTATVRQMRRLEWIAAPLPKFGHGAVADAGPGRKLVGSYHPSQRNTFTGRLTHEMLVDVFRTAKKLANG